MSEIQGMKELQKKLQDMSDNAKALDGEHSLSIDQLLSEEFLGKCSRFHSSDELIADSGLEMNTAEDFDGPLSEGWNSYIRENTSYSSWKDMLTDAGKEWVTRQMGF
jgi:hypothetical protein